MHTVKTLLSALTCTISAVTAFAQTNNAANGLEEIVVTAQKREQRLSEVPISITAFSAEQIEKAHLESAQDYMAVTPNVGFFTVGNSIDQTIAIRGVTNIGGYVNSLGIYVDEFNVTPGSASATYEQNLLDLERIEVLRGPQGILFGRNLIGGAISLTTKKPTATFAADTTVEYGNHDSWLLKGSANLPLVDDRAAVRVTAFGKGSDGWLHDIGPAGNRNDSEGKGGRVALRLTPTDALTIDLTGAHTQYDQGISSLVPSGVMHDVLRSLGLTTPVDDGQGFYPQNTRTIATDTRSFSSNETTIATARVAWDAENFSVISVSGYLQNDAAYGGDGDFTATAYSIDRGDEALETYSTELRVQSTGDGQLSWLAGAAYTNDETEDYFLRVLQPAFMSLLFHQPVNFTRRIIDNMENATAESYALFGDLTWRSASHRLTTSIGARYTHDRVFNSLFDNSQQIVTGVPLDNGSGGTKEFSDLSPRVSAVFALTPEINLYGTVAKGFKSGGFNFGAEVVADAPPSFDEEVAWNYEAGVKGLFFDRRLQANLSVFLMKWDDIQVSTRFLNENFERAQFIVNAASASTKGVELELIAEPIDELQLQASVGYDRARFDRFPGALDTFGEQFDASDNRLPFAPEWSASAAAEYRLRISDRLRSFIRGEYIYHDKLYTNSQNRPSAGLWVPAYDSVNLRLGVQTERVDISAFAENLLDDDYIVGAYETQYLSGNALVLSPRRVGVRLTYHFD